METGFFSQPLLRVAAMDAKSPKHLAQALVLGGCATAASPSPESFVPATANPRPTQTVAPTTDPTEQFAALAATVNRKWKAHGTPFAASDLSYPRQQEYVSAWRALENEIEAGLASIGWPAAMSSERGALEAAVQELQTLLDPSANAEEFLMLIGYQPLNDQRAAAAAVRVRLGLPPLGADDLI